MYGKAYLKNKLSCKQGRVSIRYEYYSMKNHVNNISQTLPQQFRWLRHSLGWCAKTVDSVADRLIFRGFKNDNFDMQQIFNMNNPDIFFDSAIISALISSCCFIYISPGEDGFPRLQVIDGYNATGIIDPITGLLTEGYAVISRDEYENPDIEAYFTADSTIYSYKGQPDVVIENKAPYPLLVPIIYKPDAKRPFGRSRITRAEMSIMQSALRTLRRAEVSGEFYSYPQRYLLGLSDDVEIDDKWQAAMTAMLTITRDADGNIPTAGQFPQQSMTPYVEQLRMLAALFAGESGLTMDDLGFVSDNPSSSEAIKASHENLRLAAKKAQRTFGSGFLNVGYLAACVRDEYSYKRQQVYLTKPCWEPIFEPDAATLSSIGDGAIKVNQAVPGYFTADNLRDLTGIEKSEGK